MKKTFYFLAAFIIIHSSFNISNASAQSVQIYRAGSAVGTPHSTLASAIAAAINGDSLKLSAHTFYEHDVLINKNLVIAGTYSSPDSTTIDAQSLGRVLMTKSKFITLRDLIITHGKVSGGTSAGFINSGGGIRIDTTGVLVLCGRTIVRNNSATGFGGGICSPNATTYADSLILKLKDHSEVSNNIAGSKAGIGLQANFRTKLYLSDNVLISGNNATQVVGVSGGIDAFTIIVEGEGAEGGVRVINNTTSGYGGGVGVDTLYLNGTMTVSNNKADSMGGGFGRLLNVHGSGKLIVEFNRAYYGGGLGYTSGYFGGENAKIVIKKNSANYGGGIACINFPNAGCKNIQLIENTASIAGGGAYFRSVSSIKGFLLNANIENNKSPLHSGVFAESNINLRIIGSRLFNPLPSGAHSNEEVYIATNSSLESDSCWFGESDTTSLIRKDASSSIYLTRTVKCDWQINNGLPVTDFPFPLTARFKLSTGAPMPMGSFPMLEGRFSGTMGSFSPAISPMKTINEIESIYTATSTGSASIMGIVDADTFKANLTVSSIQEIGFEQVKIFPNPATDVIYLQGVAAGSTIELYDVMGKLVLQKLCDSSLTKLDVEHLTKGTYTLKIITKEGNEGSAKVMKE